MYLNVLAYQRTVRHTEVTVLSTITIKVLDKLTVFELFHLAARLRLAQVRNLLLGPFLFKVGSAREIPRLKQQKMPEWGYFIKFNLST